METPKALQGPPVLINATGRPVYVLVNDKPKALPTAPTPELIGHREELGEIEISVLSKKGKIKGTTTLQLDGADSPSFIINDPERIDGVLYLVEPDILSAFPHREDFVAPSRYTFAGDLFMGKWDRDNADGISDAEIDKLMPLMSVTKHPEAAASSETPAVNLD